jgi:proteasome accessory factor A
VAAADLLWTDIRPERSLSARLAATGAIETMFGEAEVAAAITTPPPGTRAWTRGRAVASGRAVAAHWVSATLADDDAPRRLDLTDPLAGSALDSQKPS